jgi:FKBP-type peptidyl-prolyl cis-trans isomerase 2
VRARAHAARRREEATVRTTSALLLAALVFLFSSTTGLAEEKEAVVIEEGRTVSIEYTLKLDDGTVADTNVGGSPLVYQHGGQQILPSLEQALGGLAVNDTKQVDLSAEQGYGPVNPEAFQDVPVEAIPEEARQAGTTLVAEDRSGNRRPVRVHEVLEDKIVLNLNHPLAGQALHFDVKVLGIE